MLDALKIAAHTASGNLAYSCQTPIKTAGVFRGHAEKLDSCASDVLFALQHYVVWMLLVIR